MNLLELLHFPEVMTRMLGIPEQVQGVSWTRGWRTPYHLASHKEFDWQESQIKSSAFCLLPRSNTEIQGGEGLPKAQMSLIDGVGTRTQIC